MTVSPFPELLVDPRSLADGKVSQRVADRLGSGSLDLGVTGFLVVERGELADGGVFFSTRRFLERWREGSAG